MVVLGIGGGPRGPFTSYRPSDLPLGTGHLYSKTVFLSALPCTFHGMATNWQQDAGHCANASASALHEDIFWNVTRGLNTSAQVSVLTRSTYGSIQRPLLKLLVSLPLEAMKSLNNTQLTSDETFTRIFTSPCCALEHVLCRLSTKGGPWVAQRLSVHGWVWGWGLK